MASSMLKLGMPARSLEIMERVLDEDRDRDHISAVFKHFAMGKVLHALGRPEEALDHLDTAAYRAAKGEPVEYVYELAARCCLVIENTDRATAYIEKITPRRRRPYIQWTHADTLAAAGRREEALTLLKKSAERDRRTRHVALIRMARIHYATGNMEDALRHASGAADFCEQTFGNASNEALFWKAAALHGLSRDVEAREVLEDLSARRFQYPNLGRLLSVVRQAAGERQRRNGKDGRPPISLVL
jgi:tetratricopeptide (TPR) repeat protein